MDIAGVEPYISEFVLKLLGTGIWLTEFARDRVIEHLRLTLEMSRHTHGGDGRLERTYG